MPLGTPIHCPWICLIIRNMNIYIWFKGGDLNGFQDIRPLMKWKGWACPRGPPVSVIGCILS